LKPDVWRQLKGITSSQLIVALRADGWVERASGGSAIVFKKDIRKVSVHSHPHKTYGPKQLIEIVNSLLQIHKRKHAGKQGDMNGQRAGEPGDDQGDGQQPIGNGRFS
jgi:predicted RNA binding protein YcfA (HicA-like mRNA interferase family)